MLPTLVRCKRANPAGTRAVVYMSLRRNVVSFVLPYYLVCGMRLTCASRKTCQLKDCAIDTISRRPRGLSVLPFRCIAVRCYQ
ncbi:hypothetical protein IF2G_07180 [Cordyceps javanica]|nr:hypothetical protein IF2G_07180 [Cordyceps javanica]